MFTDRFGLELTTTSVTARDAYVAAVDRLLAAGAETEQAFAAAIALDPHFALAHAGRARCLALYGRGTEARQAAAQARELAARAARRERQHVEALALAIEGQPAASLAATIAHLDEFPRDAMVLAPATGVFGLYGFSGRLERERELLALMDRLDPHYSDDWWFPAQHAFAQCECGLLTAAESRAERALSLNPANGWAAHARAHVYYELGEDQAADRFLSGWRPGFPHGAQLHVHISWHAALCALMLGDARRALEIFNADIRPGCAEGPPLLVLADSAALLWRIELAGGSRQKEAWPAVHSYALEKFPKAGVTFADVHNAIVFAVSGDREASSRLATELRSGIGKQWAADVAEPVARGFEAFAREDWSVAVDMMAPVVTSLVCIGGSRAQRDLVENTLLAAYIRAGRTDEAKALLGRRTNRHPTVPVAGL
jgi:tetratricopeptide (TPR) repeat protein